MASPETTPQLEFTSIYDLLSRVAAKAATLQRNARSKLYEQEDAAGYLIDLRERASLISDLPTILDEYRQSGGTIPGEVNDFARFYAHIALEALLVNSSFMLGTILDLSPGGLATDPNDLERLAARFKPPQK